MSHERHERAKEIFLLVCDQPREDRAAVLDAACGADAGLRREVEDLLSFDPGPKLVEPAVQSSPPEMDDFKVLQKLGEGGMGEVWEAEQLQPVRRRVALKLIRMGLSSSEVLGRFESERQALALMSHTNIARVYGAGTTRDGRPFFTMELVKGVPLTEYCDAVRLSAHERLKLFIQVCDGVRHAHQKGIIHRDLKPSNVLVESLDRPTPKIIDFGVAKATSHRLTERTVFTRHGQWIGTPEYMSPEQAELTGLDIDTRSDVYSLGVLLYELLVGTPPFDQQALRQAGFDEMRRLIREDDPPRPSTRITTMGEGSELAAQRRRTDPRQLARLLRGDLDWIVMKALEKDRNRRYGSVGDLAADLERHLRDEPVAAGPPGSLYLLGKLLHRHRLMATAVAVASLALAAGVAGVVLGLVQARKEAAESRRALDFLTGIFTEIDPAALRGHTSSLREILDRGAERLEREFGDRPLARARLMAAVGQAYQGFGAYEQGRPLLEQALAIRREQLGEHHPEVVDSLSKLGWLLTLDGQFDAALPLFEQALSIREELYGASSAAVGVGLSELSYSLCKVGDLEQAGEVCRRSAQILDSSSDVDDVTLAQALYLLQTVLRERAEFDDALVMAERVCELRERSLGPDHTLVGWALHELAVAHRNQGDHEEARSYARRSLEVQEGALGEDHFAVSFPLSQLALIDLVAAGETSQARVGFERALAIREEALGPAHPDLVWILRPYGDMLHFSGEPEAGRLQLERAVEISERAYGPDHVEVGKSLTRLAQVVGHQGDLDRCRELNTRSLGIFTEAYGPRSFWRGGNLVNLACVAELSGDRRTALDHLHDALTSEFAHPVVFEDPCFEDLRRDPRFEPIATETRRLLQDGTPWNR
jgi:serine/threonine protein kinase